MYDEITRSAQKIGNGKLRFLEIAFQNNKSVECIFREILFFFSGPAMKQMEKSTIRETIMYLFADLAGNVVLIGD